MDSHTQSLVLAELVHLYTIQKTLPKKPLVIYEKFIMSQTSRNEHQHIPLSNSNGDTLTTRRAFS